MDTLQKLFQYIPSVLGLLVAWLVFIGGFIAGVLFTWPLKQLILLLRRRADKEVKEAINSLKEELQNLDCKIEELWTISFPPNRLRVPIKSMRTQGRGENATADILKLKLDVITLTGNISSVMHHVRNSSKEEFLLEEPSRGSHQKPDLSPKRSQADSPQSSRDPDKEVQHSSDEPTFNSQREVIEFYNRGVNDPAARERFREEFMPLRIGTVNAVERRQNPTIEAEFREATDGDFLALPIYGGSDFAVFPRFGLTIEAVNYGAGAMGKVFAKTHGHDPKLFYSHYRVKEPAVFRIEGDRWQLRKPGELELGVGEQ